MSIDSELVSLSLLLGHSFHEWPFINCHANRLVSFFQDESRGETYLRYVSLSSHIVCNYPREEWFLLDNGFSTILFEITEWGMILFGTGALTCDMLFDLYLPIFGDTQGLRDLNTFLSNRTQVLGWHILPFRGCICH